MNKDCNVSRISWSPLALLIAWLMLPCVVDAQSLNFDPDKPIKLSGSINLSFETYSQNGLEFSRRKPTSWLVSGSPTLAIYGIQVPVTMIVSNFESRFYQPFNQYGISPSYKWATAHIGYRNVQFSPFTLAGHRMLGGGLELNPGKIRAGFMYGRLNRATVVDSVMYSNPLAYNPKPTYTRMAYAGKLGYGSDKSYIDATILRGWDNEMSLSAELRDSIPAAENTALGLGWKLQLAKKLSWQTDLGVSLYTNDINRSSLIDSSNTSPVLERLDAIFGLKSSTQLLTAAETKVAYQDVQFGLTFSYKRIDPDYKSMGAYFFQSDVQQFQVSPSFRLDQGRLFVSGGIGIQRDNLAKLKLSTSNRFTGNVNVNYNPSPSYGINLNYSNFGITQNPLYVSAESEAFKQVSQSFIISPYFNKVGDNQVQNVQLMASIQSLNSPSRGLNAAVDQKTITGSLIYGYTLLQSAISLNASANVNNTSLSVGNAGSYGLGIGASKPLFDNAVNVSLNGMYNSNYFDGSSNGYTLNGMMQASYRVYKNNSIQIQGLYMKNKADDETVFGNFSELTFRIGYGMRF